MSDADIIFIRTHRFGETEYRLATRLEKVFGSGNVAVCVDESRGVSDTGRWPKSALTPARAVELTGTSVPADWGWRMGDLCHIAISQDFGLRPYQWLIENDVHIPEGQEAVVFDRLRAIGADFMACDLRIKKVKPIAIGVSPVLTSNEWGCIFAFNRLAGGRVPALHAARCAIARSVQGAKLPMPNDEAVLTNLAQSAGWHAVNLFEAAPDIFSRHWFDTNPPFLREHLEAQTDRGLRVSHPVLAYDQIMTRLRQAGADGHPQPYKAGRLSRILAVLPPDRRQDLLDLLPDAAHVPLLSET